MINRIKTFLITATRATVYAVAGVVALAAISTVLVKASSAPLHRSIVKVLNTEGTGGGTGWVTLTSSGKRVIVTNDHVCQVSNTDYIRIDDDSGKSSIKRILKRSFMRDLCVIEGVEAPPLFMADTGPKRHEEVRVMGHPLLFPSAPTSGVYTGDILIPFFQPRDKDGTCPEGTEEAELRSVFGPIEACRKVEELSVTTAPIAPGSSGSPVLNTSGQVIGVMNSAMSENYGMFIPLTYVKEILED
jgi:S1-C subfamily serine protease